jgi:hypothetical protein
VKPAARQLPIHRTTFCTRNLSIRFCVIGSANSLGQLAQKMLVAFLESDFAIPHGHIIGVEEELRGDVLPGCPDLLARLDLITETDDDVVITDLKTSRPIK